MSFESLSRSIIVFLVESLLLPKMNLNIGENVDIFNKAFSENYYDFVLILQGTNKI
jgi:hypothetical protein